MAVILAGKIGQAKVIPSPWVRASLGRPRYDQLMRFTWKILLPIALGYMIITALLTVFFK